jgi:hypothetical protein
MPNLLVDISFLEQLTALLDQLVSRVEQSQRANQSTFLLEEADWQGHFRQNFDQQYTEFVRANNGIIERGQALSQRIRETIARFEQIEGSTSISSG